MKRNTKLGRRFVPVRRTVLISAALAAVVLVAGCQPGGRRGKWKPSGGEPIRAIWVTRWDYKSARDIPAIMENCRSAGFNTVLFQVRGNGTAFYRSRIEPWADELGGRDPGFDPLAVACKEAHRRGLSLHAWVNVMPGWRGNKPPTNRKQLYWAHPEWFWRDASGRRQPLGWYNSLNPCYPEVRSYLVAVMRDIVGRYPVDGLHLDYIRFPNEWHKSYLPRRDVPDYPRDGRTLALFRRATRQTPDSAPHLWNRWRTEQVTQVVREIRSMMLSVRPKACLSAAVGADPRDSKRGHFQDSKGWLAEGLVDAVFPMNYASDMKLFTERTHVWSGMWSRVSVVTGVMFDKRDAATVVKQIERARASSPHFAAFAYNSLFERPGRLARGDGSRESAQRSALRRRVIPYLRRLATKPV